MEGNARMSDLSDTLKAWRARLGITQAQAADVLDVPLRTYQGFEAGKTERLPVRIVEYALEHVEKNSKKLL